MFKKKNPTEIVDQCVQKLKNQLGENLYSCLVYGSLVRGHFIDRQSDINLLIILKESTFEAHRVIGQIIREHAPIDPFTVGIKGIERTMKVFGLKFASIQRNYKVLSGEDPFTKFKLDSELDRFLCEQSLRNVRLRHVHQFIMNGDNCKRYSFYLKDLTPTLFTDISEIARLGGVQLPQEFADRIPLLEKHFDINLQILTDLLQHKEKSNVVSAADKDRFQSHLLEVLNTIIFWIESKWDLPLVRGPN